MPIAVTVPRLGWNMEEGTFIEWLKADGDTVRSGDTVFRLEGEKSVEEIESLDAGVLHIPADGPKPGDRVLVGVTIGYLLQAGESVPGQQPTPPEPVTVRNEPAASPAMRRMARERGIDLEQLRGSGPGGRITAEDFPQPQDSARNSSTISPRARRLATRLGIDWSKLQGSGRTGRIRERDIAAISQPLPVQTAGVVPLTPIRKTIASRMQESHQTTAPVTLTSAVDATNLANLHRQFKAVTEGAPIPSYTDFLVKLVGFTLQKHPLLASRWTDAGIILTEQIDIGVAVDTEAGLLVPVIRDVPLLGLRQVAVRSRELIELARRGELPMRDMQGGCFTITNLGAYGVDAFTPIINPPECAILGVGRIERRAVMDGERVVGREVVTLSLTFDHRIVDGAPAARFLQTLAQLIENPGPWLST
ncbi:MAG TPA: dihydrolipoamide acetyltransferase family protein [Gemmata sp.]|jgi:pyruvate dehydrogenase E2 component (dihydrolipoamide acetyltransferase)|nr:dihydrolipoamide acetyltransferase family protein [Gemmata sp.]